MGTSSTKCTWPDSSAATRALASRMMRMVMVSKYAVFCPPRPSRPAGAGLGTYPSKRLSFTWESGTHSTNW